MSDCLASDIELEDVCMLQVLEREERSLGALLEEFCSVHKQKRHQLADWRQRCRSSPPESPEALPCDHLNHACAKLLYFVLFPPECWKLRIIEALRSSPQPLARASYEEVLRRSQRLTVVQFHYCRPLPRELLEYAQTDVRHLCYLAGQLCAELASKGPDCLREASRRSHEMCLALYSKAISEVSPLPCASE